MMFQKILIGIDDSRYAENAAQQGFELAHQFNAQVALVHIVEPIASTTMNDSTMLGGFMPSLSPIEDPELLNVQQTYSQRLIDSTIEKWGQGLQVTQFNEFGSTGEAIISCAAQFNADLIVVGTHSRSGFDRLLMGSVAEYVVRHSLVSVLVVPLKMEESGDQ